MNSDEREGDPSAAARQQKFSKQVQGGAAVKGRQDGTYGSEKPPTVGMGSSFTKIKTELSMKGAGD